MGRELSLFVGTFATLLAIINPLEVLPVYLKMLEGRDSATHRRVAWKACLYALLLSLFFLIFGTLILRLFGVPLSMPSDARRAGHYSTVVSTDVEPAILPPYAGAAYAISATCPEFDVPVAIAPLDRWSIA